MDTETAVIDPSKTHSVKDLKHGSPLISCRFDRSGKYLFAGAQDYQVVRWEIESGQKTVVPTGSWVRAIEFDPAGNHVLTGGYDGRVLWWPVTGEVSKPVRSLDAHAGWVRAVAVHAQDGIVATAGNDLVVRLWSADGGGLAEFKGHESHIYNLVFHPDGKHLVSGDLKCNLFVWEIATGKLITKLTAGALYKYDKGFRADIGGFRGMVFDQNGKWLACSGITNVTNAFAGVGNPAVVVFDWESGKEKIQHHSKGKIRGVAWGVAIHSDGTRIAASGGGGGGFLLFWKPEEKEEFHQMKLPDTARDLHLHTDGLHVATAHHDGNGRIYKMAAKES